LWLCTSQSAFASGWVPTTKQYFLLPDYCKAKMSDVCEPLAGEIGRTSDWRGEAASMLVPEAQIPRWKNGWERIFFTSTIIVMDLRC
jgi:hypothetical protein